MGQLFWGIWILDMVNWCQVRMNNQKPQEGQSPPESKERTGLSYIKNNQPACQWVEISLFSGNLRPNGAR